MRQAWPEATRLFLVDKHNRSKEKARGIDSSIDFPDYDRVRWRSVLSTGCRLDVLIVHQPRNVTLQNKWERQFLESRHRPKILVVVERDEDLLTKEGQEHRSTIKRIQK